MIAIEPALKEIARRIGLDLVGIAGAAPFAAEEEALRQRAARGLVTPFVPADPAERCRPELALPGARSIVSAAASYYHPFPRLPATGPVGEVSRYAWGADYHRILGGKLDLLAGWLRERGAACRVMADTGPLLDRAVARRAGLGWIGKNGCLITPRYGSWVFLGEIVTTAELAPDPPFTADGCSGCDLCLRACPTGAIVEPGVVDHRRCLSYVTQMKGAIPPHLRPALGRRVWGCDTCQAVCPPNRRLARRLARCPTPRQGGDRHPANPEFAPRSPLQVRPPLATLLEMDNSRFRGVYAATAMGWRGRKTLQRNALVALGNALAGAGRTRPDAVRPLLPALDRALRDERAEIREHAAWALDRIGGTVRALGARGPGG